MNPRFLFILFLAGLSLVSGYLASKASLVGRLGISLFYREYQFLKTGWGGALAAFALFLFLFLFQYLISKTKSRNTAIKFFLAFLFLGLAGLIATYLDFRNTLSHRWLGERFHLGFYLFWIGWMSISIFYLWPRKESV